MTHPLTRTVRVAAGALLLLAVAWAQGGAQTASPLSVQIGGAQFTPGGFLDLTSVFRTTNVGSGIGTAFGSIPFSNTAAGQLSEFRFSAQNSRLSLRVDSQPGGAKLTGYVEADFLGNAPGNLVVGSNSNTLRMRLYWVDIRKGGWEVLAGQSWSLLTPNRKGLSPMPSDIFYSQDMDTNYQVGLTWSRDPQLRVIRHFGSNWALGVSFENPEQYIGSAGTVTLPAASYASQFSTGANSATPNLHPDIVAKLAYDTTAAGHAVHLELAGLERTFRDVNPATNVKSTIAGGGVSLNGNVELVKNFRVIATSFYSDGGGRYIFGLGPDLVVHADGTLSAVHSASGIGGFEWQATPAWLLYGYYGGAYFQRNFETTPAGDIGFGYAGSPSAANRAIQEGTVGIIHTFWRKPSYGALALITQYSYLVRAPWSVAAGSPRTAKSNMVWVDLRYTLP